MKLENALIGVDVPQIPECFKDRIHFCTTCHLSYEEIGAFELSLQALALALEESAPPLLPSSVTMIATEQETISFTFLSPSTLGLECSLVIYPIYHWRARNLSFAIMMVAVLEELCHCFWQLPDGPAVQQKVVAVLQKILPTVRLEDVYNLN